MQHLLPFIARTLLAVALFMSAQTFAQMGDESQFSFELRDTDLREFIASVAALNEKTVIIDPKVKGKVNIKSYRGLAPEEMYQVLLSQLQVNGYLVIEQANDVLKIVPDQRGKIEGGVVQLDNAPKPFQGDQIITRVIEINHVAANNLVAVLRPMVDAKIGIIGAYVPTNIIIITDRSSNVRRILEVIEAIDQSKQESVESIPLKNSGATEISRVISNLLQGKEDQGLRYAKVTVDERTNSIIIRGNQAQRKYIRELIVELDQNVTSSALSKVFYLKYAKADKLSEVLRRISSAMLEGQGGKSSKRPSSLVSIEADEETNAVIISGSQQWIKEMGSIISQLDIRRAQVLVEAVIAEIADTRSKELGIQWLFGDLNGEEGPAGAIDFGQSTGVSITQVGAAANSGDTDALAQALSGLRGFGAGVGRMSDNGISFAALITAISQDQDSNILSTPSLLAIDNEDAKIHVGQEVPIITGSTASDNNANPFQTIERKDIGVKLNIRPQINEGDSMRLEITQEVSSLAGTTSADIITNKRLVETTVQVDNGQLVVLGGLIDDDVQQSTSKVPLLGSIPGVGRLFRSDGTRRVKRNLLVFIRARIVRDADTLAELSKQKYSYIRAEQLIQQKEGVNLFPRDEKVPLLEEWGQMNALPATSLPTEE